MNAVALSFITSPAKEWEIALNYRDLPSYFVTPFGGTFGINSSDAKNEVGLYMASKLTVTPQSLSIFASANISKSDSPGRTSIQYFDIRIGRTSF